MANKTASTTAGQPTIAELMAAIQSLQAAQAAPAKSAKVTKSVKADKPYSSFGGKALAKELEGKPGTLTGETGTGRKKVTAFCSDGTVVTVII